MWRVRQDRARTRRSWTRQCGRYARPARPLIVAGGGVHHSEAEQALRALVDAAAIPVASTQAGKGALRHDHPADLGGIGHTGTAVSDELARTADLVIGVGTRYTDFTTASGTLFQRPGVRFVNLNVTAFDAHKLAARHPGVRRAGRPERAGRALAGYRVDAAYEAEYRTGRARWDEVVEGAFGADDDSAVPTQTQVLGALDAVVGDEDVVINAAGSLPGDLHKLWRARVPAPVPPGTSCRRRATPSGC
ncbi:3D-(3,5/4)-trihydroxycyclohexane-1,2-dione acylhydrolase (Decyclizing) OS=Streptomyces albaduncus OX=68172 GN=FHS32_002373 PE=3 SV=1 [Streptomyces griseoloalbus]